MPPRKSATRPKRTFKSAAVAVDSDVADESLPESPTLPVTPKQRKSARTSGKTPVTPTPTQTQRGTKRSVEENSDDNSDGSNPEVPKSPKKRRAILTTPEQIQQAARLRVSSRALAFPSQSVDAKVEEDSSSLSDVPSSDTAGIAEESSDVENKAPTDVFLDDLSPDPPKQLELEKCGVYSRKLADPLLRDTYPDRPHLPG
ncbi:hypothetical protein CPB83DRAFT_900781 [Crepidotus variabilis]|uniref:Uncharacterized protein n=1 Tax=Crepidotus variabilis TaxID=179855 RepID=A0A9P6E2J2_9AGAR|nr:hypothetical protein CPB83DRAFT_900781 [Crepidotus variabilis]